MKVQVLAATEHENMSRPVHAEPEHENMQD